MGAMVAMAALLSFLLTGAMAQGSHIKLRSSNLTISAPGYEPTPVPPFPSIPDIPSPPPFPSIPDIPSPPPFPSIPDIPSPPPFPSIPDIPSRPPFPSIPDVPSRPPFPSIPDVPSPPPFPSIPSIPGRPGSGPSIPGRPELGRRLLVAPEDTKDEAAITGILTSLGKTGNLEDVAEYAQAYVEVLGPDSYKLQGGINPLDSFTSVEANDTLIHVNETGSYESLEVLLVANNTLIVDNASVLGLFNSTLWLAETSWLKIANNSLLNLNDSRLNVTNFFTWYVDNSSVSSSSSILETNDALTWFDNSDLYLLNSTLVTGSAGYPEPAPFVGSLPIVFAATNSSVELDMTSWEADNMLVHFNTSTISLKNSTITLRNATLNIWDSVLDLTNSEILLYNSTLGLYGTTETLGEVDFIKIYEAGSVTGPAVSQLQAQGTPESITESILYRLVGKPLGTVPLELVDADVDFGVEDLP